MTETPPKCAHPNIEYDVAGATRPGTNVIITEIAHRCADCGQMMRWLGHMPSDPRPDRPSLSEDRLWLSLPAVPDGENPYELLIPETKQ